MTRTAIVVGGGLGGLATAIRMQYAGWHVTLVEQNSRVGGRCNLLQADGYTFDTGPTLLLMRDVLDDLFASVDRRLEDYLDLVRVSPNYRIRFGDGSALTLSSDMTDLSAQVERFEVGAGDALERYLADAGYKYRVSRDRFVERNFAHWYQFATLHNLYYLLRTTTLRKLDNHAARYFSDPRLQLAFTFQTMYLGLAPRDAPSVYSLLPYTELREGIWYPQGGMYQVAAALEKLACELGVDIQLCSRVERLSFHDWHATGVELDDGRRLAADVVIVNSDLPSAYENLVPRKYRGRFTDRALRRLDYGSSAFLMYLGLDRTYPHMHHHDVYLSADSIRNFDDIFRHGRLPDDPSFYACTPSRTDSTLAPPGCDTLYVLVPVPNAGASVDWTAEAAPFRDLMYRHLERTFELTDLRGHVTFERVYTPVDFQRDYSLARGSAFGLSHGFKQVGYMRPANRARDVRNLYFVGASTVPGGGVPMVVIGSRLVTERVQEEWGHA